MSVNVPIPSIDELAANVARLLQQQFAEANQTAQPAELSATDLDLARSNIKALSFVMGMGLHGVYRYLRDFIAAQAIPVSAVDEFLDGWLATYNMVRKEASAASGQVLGTGVNGTILAAGTRLQAADGRQYSVTTDATVSGGVVVAAAAAVVAGAAGNLGEDSTLTLVSSVPGIDADFSCDLGMSGGADAETNSDAAYRLTQRLSSEPMGGAPADYARWALAVPGITRAWGVRNPAGPTSAGVIIMADGNTSSDGLPTLTQRDAVLDYIRDPLRGPPDELFVIIPTPVVINFEIHLSPDTAAIRTAVTDGLADLFFREAQPGGSIPMSHATEVISAVVGEYNHTISSPVIESGGFFTTASFDQLLMLGTVTFS